MSEEMKDQQQSTPVESEPTEQNQPEKQEKTYTEDELKEKIQQAVQKRFKKYEGFDDMKKQLEELQKYKEETENAKLSEQERKAKELEKLMNERQSLLEQLEKLESERKQERLNNKFKELAQQKGIQYLDAAQKLADLSSVEIDDEGNFNGIEDVIEKLVEENPFLVGQKKEEPKPIGGSSNPADGVVEKTAEQAVKELEEDLRKGWTPQKAAKLSALKRKLGLY